MLQAKMLDVLNLLFWAKTKDAEKGRNKPESVFEKMLNKENTDKKEFKHDVFDSVEEFEKAREKALRG